MIIIVHQDYDEEFDFNYNDHYHLKIVINYHFNLRRGESIKKQLADKGIEEIVNEKKKRNSIKEKRLKFELITILLLQKRGVNANL